MLKPDDIAQTDHAFNAQLQTFWNSLGNLSRLSCYLTIFGLLEANGISRARAFRPHVPREPRQNRLPAPRHSLRFAP